MNSSQSDHFGRSAAWVGWILAASLLGAVAAEAQTRIKLGSLAPSGTSYHRILLELGEQLRACPDGGFHLTVYPGGVLGGEADHVRKMRIGQINAALLTASGLGEIDPSMNAFQRMPMMFRSLEEVEFVRSRLEPVLSRRLQGRGFVALFWGDAGWLRFFSREPGLRPEDFKKIKMFVGAGELEQIDLMKKAGFQVVPLELSDVLTALKTGVVDAVPTVPFHALAGQFYTVTRHMLTIDYLPLVGGAVVTRKLWDSLAPAARECLKSAAAVAGDKIKLRSRQENEEAMEAMVRKQGLQVHPVSPALEAEWRAAAETYYPEIRGSLVPADIFDEVRRLLAEFRPGGRIDGR